MDRNRRGYRVDVAEAVGLLLTGPGRADPYPTYEALRAHGPVISVGEGFCLATGYAAVDEVLRNPELRVQDKTALEATFPDWAASRTMRFLAASMLFTNPPEHSRMRRLAAGAFTPRRVAALQETVAGYATELADRLAELGGGGSPVDFMAEYAYALPVRVICALLGVPAQDHSWLRRRAEYIAPVLDPQTETADLQVADLAVAELEEYFTELVDARRRAPGDDLTTALVQAHDAEGGGRLSGEELLANLILLLFAGFETTTNLLGNGVMLLLRHPHRAARLRADPGLAPGYVEEVLRFDSPVQLTSRWTVAPTVVAGVRVPAHHEIMLLIGAANRDPARFDHPDRFDPDRPANQPLSFGGGAHFCLGAALARLEGRVALPTLLRRLPDLAPGGDPIRCDRLTLRGYASLPVRTG